MSKYACASELQVCVYMYGFSILCQCVNVWHVRMLIACQRFVTLPEKLIHYLG